MRAEKGKDPPVAFKRLNTFFEKEPNGRGEPATLNADELLRKAREKSVYIENEAYEKGYAQGEKDGLEFGKQKLTMALQNLTKIINEIDQHKIALYERFEGEIIKLVLVVAKKIVHREAVTSPDIIKEVVRAALKRVIDNSKVVIRIHPNDFSFVDEIKADFLEEIEGLMHTEIMEDRNVKQGGCLIETDSGTVDATVDSQLVEIEAAMDKVLKGHSRQETGFC